MLRVDTSLQERPGVRKHQYPKTRIAHDGGHHVIQFRVAPRALPPPVPLRVRHRSKQMGCPSLVVKQQPNKMSGGHAMAGCVCGGSLGGVVVETSEMPVLVATKTAGDARTTHTRGRHTHAQKQTA